VDFRSFDHNALLNVANRIHRIRNSEYKVFFKDIPAKAHLFEPIRFRFDISIQRVKRVDNRDRTSPSEKQPPLRQTEKVKKNKRTTTECGRGRQPCFTTKERRAMEGTKSAQVPRSKGGNVRSGDQRSWPRDLLRGARHLQALVRVSPSHTSILPRTFKFERRW
jgi:hypothetical protein